MTQADVDRIENEKALAKLRAEQDKALAEAKKAEDEKIAEPIEFKKPEDDLPPAGDQNPPAGDVDPGAQAPTVPTE